MKMGFAILTLFLVILPIAARADVDTLETCLKTANAAEFTALERDAGKSEVETSGAVRDRYGYVNSSAMYNMVNVVYKSDATPSEIYRNVLRSCADLSYPAEIQSQL